MHLTQAAICTLTFFCRNSCFYFRPIVFELKIIALVNFHRLKNGAELRAMTKLTEVCFKQKNSFITPYGRNRWQKNGRAMEKNAPTLASILKEKERKEEMRSQRSQAQGKLYLAHFETNTLFTTDSPC